MLVIEIADPTVIVYSHVMCCVVMSRDVDGYTLL